MFDTDISEGELAKDLRIEGISFRNGDALEEETFTSVKKHAIEELQRLVKLEQWFGQEIKFKNPVEDIKVRTRRMLKLLPKKCGSVGICSIIQ